MLVGGGPGDVGLLTLAGRRALAEADVVVTDRLGPVAVLDELAPGVEIIDVGKTPGHHPVPQHEIGRILVEQAQRGRAVVRLKGGDPFVYGRGGEEVARVPGGRRRRSTVVPGVSSAFAAPAAAGIPLTHRGTVGAVHVMNGHDGWSSAALDGPAGRVVHGRRAHGRQRAGRRWRARRSTPGSTRPRRSRSSRRARCRASASRARGSTTSSTSRPRPACVRPP